MLYTILQYVALFNGIPSFTIQNDYIYNIIIMYVCFVNGIPSMLDNSFLFTICQTCLDSSSAVRNGAGRPGRRPPERHRRGY